MAFQSFGNFGNFQLPAGTLAGLSQQNTGMAGGGQIGLGMPGATGYSSAGGQAGYGTPGAPNWPGAGGTSIGVGPAPRTGPDVYNPTTNPTGTTLPRDYSPDVIDGGGGSLNLPPMEMGTSGVGGQPGYGAPGAPNWPGAPAPAGADVAAAAGAASNNPMLQRAAGMLQGAFRSPSGQPTQTMNNPAFGALMQGLRGGGGFMGGLVRQAMARNPAPSAGDYLRGVGGGFMDPVSGQIMNQLPSKPTF